MLFGQSKCKVLPSRRVTSGEDIRSFQLCKTNSGHYHTVYLKDLREFDRGALELRGPPRPLHDCSTNLELIPARLAAVFNTLKKFRLGLGECGICKTACAGSPRPSSRAVAPWRAPEIRLAAESLARLGFKGDRRTPLPHSRFVVSTGYVVDAFSSSACRSPLKRDELRRRSRQRHYPRLVCSPREAVSCPLQAYTGVCPG